jgi:4-amino-4-deoxy-L-arabinose transferase-like glycosyltransferase
MVVILAAVLRFWQLGKLPPGLYRDEAFNGLDALDVLDGQHALFFPANNGREPAYIYLTALCVSLFGRTALAIRLGAAVTGTLTTLLVYKLGKTWYGRSPALFAAFTWAVTLWPVHLSRIGLRPILLAPFLAATFWLGTLAYRRQKGWLWLIAGLAYGAAFYTYLAVRFTPVWLLALAAFLIWRGQRQRLWPGAAWFGLGTAVTLTPFALLVIQQPDILLGRTGQVSILNTAVNDGNLWETLGQHVWQALGMFLWRGDTILRHNPAGRPVFDWFMALPFLIGLGWCMKNWRRPAAMALLLWTAFMLGPTILAADTPHFLRASGLLPGIVLLPAIGLAQFGQWKRLPRPWPQAAVVLLAAGSLVLTVRDYTEYGRSPDTGYLFEAAATDLAGQINNERVGTAVFLDERYWSGWPSLSFLVDESQIHLFQPEVGLPQTAPPLTIYAWPYSSLDFVPAALPANVLITVESGSLARGDLEPEPYSLYVRYAAQPPPLPEPPLANFDNQMHLVQAVITAQKQDELTLELVWGMGTAVLSTVEAAIPPNLKIFIHVTGTDGFIGQDDAPLANGYWPDEWWQTGQLVQETQRIRLTKPYDPARHQVLIGLYDAQTNVRLPVLNASGEVVGDSWELTTDD